jgi:hypothetical protein
VASTKVQERRRLQTLSAMREKQCTPASGGLVVSGCLFIKGGKT